MEDNDNYNIEINSGSDKYRQNNKNEKNENQIEPTLDEPISKTIMKDLQLIYEKTKIAMLPMKESNSTDKLKDWDFWGPLIFCLFLGLILSLGRNDENGGIVFILIFAIVWIGGFIISINSQFLGTKLTVYQSICILGYCMFAIVLSSLINLFLIFIPSVFKLGIGICGCAYSIYGKIFFFIIFFFSFLFFFC
jgi:hypothetical protein